MATRVFGLGLIACALSWSCGSDDGASGSTHATGGASSGGASSGGTHAGGSGGNVSGGSGGASDASTGGTTSDAASGGSAGSTGGAGCTRTPGPADGPRKLVLGHPYDASGNPGNDFELFDLDASGTLTQTGTHFSLGRGLEGEIVFTPDGKLGFAVNDDGSVGVFRIEANGGVTVLNPGLSGGFYASKLVMDPSGSRVYVLDDEWRDIGGGVYALEIGCDDQVTLAGLWAPAKLPAGFVFVDSTHAVVAADDILTSASNQTLHLLNWSASPSLVTSVVAFTGDAPIVSSLALTHDGKFLLVADDNQFSSTQNRVGVVSLAGNALTAVQEVTPVDDPADIETSPFDDSALVTSAFGNAIVVLAYDAQKPSAPYTASALAVSGKAPELPTEMSMIRRGTLSGRVFVSEVSAIRQVVFASGQAPSDLGTFALGSGSEAIAGAIGVQP